MSIQQRVLFSASTIKIGNRYGKLVITDMFKPDPNKKRRCVRYVCDCGKSGVISKNLIARGKTSCGCGLVKDKYKTHGFTGDDATKEQRRFYWIYQGIKDRCTNSNNMEWHRYGGRGIKCERKTFEEFIDDMREGYLEHIKQHGKDTSIDRIDNDGNYNKENCRWTTYYIQSTNTSKPILVAHTKDGDITIKMLSEMTGLSKVMCKGRIEGFNNGTISYDELFSKGRLTGKHNTVYTEIDGEIYSSERLANEVGLKRATANKRLKGYREGRLTKEQIFYKGYIAH